VNGLETADGQNARLHASKDDFLQATGGLMTYVAWFAELSRTFGSTATRPPLSETETGLRRTIAETEPTIGETDAQ